MVQNLQMLMQQKNEEAFAEQFLDGKRLTLVLRDNSGNAMEILKEHFSAGSNSEHDTK